MEAAKESTDVKQSADIYHLIAWADANRKRLIIIASVVAVVGLGAGLYVWNTDRRETAANDALASLKIFARTGAVQTPLSPDDYLRIANDYAGTSAGARALLLTGSALFDAGKFTDAQRSFERFLQEYPDYPLASQAQLGIAACFEAEGNTAEAATRYKEFRERHPQDPGLPQATSALARLSEAMGKPADAFKLYQELAKNRGNDTWSAEAGIQAQELLAKHPELRQQPTPPPFANSPAMPKPALGPATGSKPAASSNLLIDIPLTAPNNH